jgi:hypothetical protein
MDRSAGDIPGVEDGAVVVVVVVVVTGSPRLEGGITSAVGGIAAAGGVTSRCLGCIATS